VIVRDRFEEDPAELGYIRLLDMEQYQSFEGSVGKNELNKYKFFLQENDRILYQHLKRNGVRYSKIYTHDEVYLKLAKLLGG